MYYNFVGTYLTVRIREVFVLRGLTVVKVRIIYSGCMGYDHHYFGAQNVHLLEFARQGRKDQHLPKRQNLGVFDLIFDLI